MQADAGFERAAEGTRFAGQLQHLVSTGSTSTLAMEAAQAGARTGVWVADEQTAGRGRGGHQWHSVAGDGLYVSVLVAPQISPALARQLPMATGLAVQAAVLEATGLALDLKWPNDLMLGEKKCGGILVESAAEAGVGAGLRFVVIGVGLNVNHGEFPPELALVATSLYRESGRRFGREGLLAALLRALELELGRLEEGLAVYGRFAESSSWVLGKRVRVGEEGAESYTGWTRGLDENGFLLVESDDGGTRTVLSGGVRAFDPEWKRE